MTPGRPAAVGGAALTPLAWADLAGWADDDHGAALAALATSAAHRLATPGASVPSVLGAALQAVHADALPPQAIFERHFIPLRVGEPGSAFVTGYYEPEVVGSIRPSTRFSAPALARPPDLVDLGPDHVVAGLDGLAAARREASGRLTPYPDRGAIEAGALDGLGLDLLYLDPVDLFFVQVQGSARVRLPDGTVLRLAYDGRNGRPYTAIGRLLADRLGVPRAGMTMQTLRAWLARNPGEARALLAQNRSYVFFRIARELDPALGPLGGEGVPLAAGRSLALDATLWPYALPVWLDARQAGEAPLRRLLVAQDTGSAIRGPARLDLFTGSGDAAGVSAGRLRATGTMIVLWPVGALP